MKGFVDNIDETPGARKIREGLEICEQVAQDIARTIFKCPEIWTYTATYEGQKITGIHFRKNKSETDPEKFNRLMKALENAVKNSKFNVKFRPDNNSVTFDSPATAPYFFIEFLERLRTIELTPTSVTSKLSAAPLEFKDEKLADMFGHFNQDPFNGFQYNEKDLRLNIAAAAKASNPKATHTVKPEKRAH